MSNQVISLPLKLIILVLVFSFCTQTQARRDDVEQPLKIEADTVVFNRQAGTAVYSGRVQVTQGTLAITADRLEISAPGNEIKTIRATGSPVNFRQVMDSGKQAVGRAKLMQYFIPQKRLILSGGASLNQGKDAFSSNHIEYSTATGELKAGQVAGGGQNQKGGRVKAIFYPNNKPR